MPDMQELRDGLRDAAAALDGSIAGLAADYEAYVSACAALRAELADRSSETRPTRLSSTHLILIKSLAKSSVVLQRAMDLGRFDDDGPQTATALHLAGGDIDPE
ncbi:MAG: hypothetical protein AB7O38_26045 [Pirellulaceae bacterium]